MDSGIISTIFCLSVSFWKICLHFFCLSVSFWKNMSKIFLSSVYFWKMCLQFFCPSVYFWQNNVYNFVCLSTFEKIGLHFFVRLSKKAKNCSKNDFFENALKWSFLHQKGWSIIFRRQSQSTKNVLLKIFLSKEIVSI